MFICITTSSILSMLFRFQNIKFENYDCFDVLLHKAVIKFALGFEFVNLYFSGRTIAIF